MKKTLENSSPYFLLLTALVIFVVGAGAGFMYKAGMGQTSNEKYQRLDKVAAALSSEMVRSIAVYGQVQFVSLEDRKITLASGQKKLDIFIPPGTKISSFAQNPKAKASAPAVEKESNIQEIRPGDYVNTTVELSLDGTLQSQMVLITVAGSGQYIQY